MTTTLDLPRDTTRRTTRPAPAPLSQACKLCGAPHPASAAATCEECLGPLEPVYDPDRPLPSATTIATRPQSLWRYREWLPFGVSPSSPSIADSLRSSNRPRSRSDSVSPGSGSRTTRCPIRRSPSRIVSSRARSTRPSGSVSTTWVVPRRATWRMPSPLRRRARVFRPGSSSRTISRWQGRRHGGLRTPARPRTGTYDDVNRLCSQVGRPFRLGSGQHQPARILRRRLQDHGVRDRRAARLADAERDRGANGRRIVAHQAGEGIP